MKIYEIIYKPHALTLLAAGLIARLVLLALLCLEVVEYCKAELKQQQNFAKPQKKLNMKKYIIILNNII